MQSRNYDLLEQYHDEGWFKGFVVGICVGVAGASATALIAYFVF